MLRAAPTTFTIALILCAYPLLVPQLLAHEDGGTHEVVVDEKLIDIGYQPEFPTTDASIWFDFSLFSATSTDTLTFTAVWVTIELADKTIFSGNITNPRIGPTGFSLLLDTPGTYTVRARYLDDTTTVALTQFALTVNALTQNQAVPNWVVAALVAGGSAMILSIIGWQRRRRLY
jgi:hypothetical protein